MKTGVPATGHDTFGGHKNYGKMLMKINIRSILCPYDFSDCAEHALQYAVAFAQAHDAELRLLHVIEPPPYSAVDFDAAAEMTQDPLTRMTNAARKELERVADRLRGELHTVHPELLTGPAFIRIIEYARDQETDLIILGTHGRSGLAHALVGSVAEKIVRKAPCPVMTVKHPEHEFVMP